MMEADRPRSRSGHGPTLAEDPALGLSQRAKMEILGAILLGLFLGALDQTIVGTALPKIVTDLGGNDLYTWVVTIYLLTSTITVPFYGKLSDIYGRQADAHDRHHAVPGRLGPVRASARTMWQLILFRGIQGLGAGALFPISLAVIGDLFTPGRARQVPGPLRRRLRDLVHRRARPRRLPHRQRQLALGLLRQPARSASSACT